MGPCGVSAPVAAVIASAIGEKARHFSIENSRNSGIRVQEQLNEAARLGVLVSPDDPIRPIKLPRRAICQGPHLSNPRCAVHTGNCITSGFSVPGMEIDK